MLSEFKLIQNYFMRNQDKNPDPRVALGIGDDCALLQTAPGTQLAISSDMLVSGRHFFPDVDPYTLGHKCLAVNLSDLAAMGARPLAFTLAIALPDADPNWLSAFSQGMFALADQHHCRLIGGDTTKGPLTISITIFGELAPNTALRRDAAKLGDDIWISGSLGDARLALAAYRNELNLDPTQHLQAAQRMHQPTPRIALGIALRGIAHAALDISDGLSGDLGHILTASRVGAQINVDALPVGEVLQSQAPARRREFCLNGGDDYELCFTAPAEKRDAIIQAGISSQTPLTRVGRIEAELGLRLIDAEGKTVELSLRSFDHFSSP